MNQVNSDAIEPCSKTLLEIPHDQILAARDTDGKFHRARLIDLDDDFKFATVCFIDFGRTAKCQLPDLYTFTCESELSQLPPRCFQAKLAEIQPSTVNISGGHMWDAAAVELFKSNTLDREITAKVITGSLTLPFQF